VFAINFDMTEAVTEENAEATGGEEQNVSKCEYCNKVLRTMNEFCIRNEGCSYALVTMQKMKQTCLGEPKELSSACHT
jgi:hypothetical protein